MDVFHSVKCNSPRERRQCCYKLFPCKNCMSMRSLKFYYGNRDYCRERPSEKHYNRRDWLNERYSERYHLSKDEVKNKRRQQYPEHKK